jgi:monoamine oxidase
MKEIFDIIVAGGGVASFNTIYELLKVKPNLKIILFEKDDVFGGRLKRGYLGNQPVDLGAVRIPTDFTLTPKLDGSFECIKNDGSMNYFCKFKISNFEIEEIQLQPICEEISSISDFLRIRKDIYFHTNSIGLFKYL